MLSNKQLEAKRKKLEAALERQDIIIGRAMEKRVTLEEQLAEVLGAIRRAAR